MLQEGIDCHLLNQLDSKFVIQGLSFYIWYPIDKMRKSKTWEQYCLIWLNVLQFACKKNCSIKNENGKHTVPRKYKRNDAGQKPEGESKETAGRSS